MNIKKITLSTLALFCVIATTSAQDMESNTPTSKFFFDANYGYAVRTAKTADDLGQVEMHMIKKKRRKSLPRSRLQNQ